MKNQIAPLMKKQYKTGDDFNLRRHVVTDDHPGYLVEQSEAEMRQRQLAGLGQDESAPVDVFTALREAGPAIQRMSRQYLRAAPFIDWVIEHPLAASLVFIGSVSAAAFAGSVAGMRYVQVLDRHADK